MGKFEIQTQDLNGTLQVKVSGTIDEDADFTKVNLAQASAVILELKDVKSINSCGIREWIKWMGTTQSPITFKECTKVIVDQINMVDGFLPQNGKVESFYVPYYSEEGGSEKNVLFRNGNEFVGGQLKAPQEVKDDSGNEMEMDVVEAKYFKFLKRSG